MRNLETSNYICIFLSASLLLPPASNSISNSMVSLPASVHPIIIIVLINEIFLNILTGGKPRNSRVNMLTQVDRARGVMSHIHKVRSPTISSLHLHHTAIAINVSSMSW